MAKRILHEEEYVDWLANHRDAEVSLVVKLRVCDGVQRGEAASALACVSTGLLFESQRK